jgi:hypothetical protein
MTVLVKFAWYANQPNERKWLGVASIGGGQASVTASSAKSITTKSG